MNASEHDSIESGAPPEQGAEELTSAVAEIEAESPPDPPEHAVAGPEADRPAETPGGEGDARPTDERPGKSDAADAEAAEEAYGRISHAEEAAELRAERDRIRDRHLRLAADFDNYRRRTEDRLRRRWDRAQADLVSRLLEPLDDLLRITTLDAGSATAEAIVEGVNLVERKFLQVFEEVGVAVVDPRGESFDPNTMEAMMRVPAASEEEDDVVERVFQRGYTLRGQLVRPARVSVFKA